MDVVVVGVDGSGNAREALRAAVDEAGWRGATVVAMHVVHYPFTLGVDGATMVDFAAIEASGMAALQRELEEVEREFPGGFPVEVRPIVRLGHVGSQLLSVADIDEDASVKLTVAGTRGRGGFKGLLLGSTTTYLVHHLKTPLLIVPHVDVPEGALAEHEAPESVAVDA
jgi:nucleotide-binding universal stress UspA family protein